MPPGPGGWQLCCGQAQLAALAAPPAKGSGSAAGNGAQAAELNADQLEVAILDRARAHRTFRYLRGPRLEELLAESRAAVSGDAPASDAPAAQEAEATPPTSDDLPRAQAPPAATASRSSSPASRDPTHPRLRASA